MSMIWNLPVMIYEVVYCNTDLKVQGLTTMASNRFVEGFSTSIK